MSDATVKIFYLDPKDGVDTNIGLSEADPLKTPTGLAISVIAGEYTLIEVIWKNPETGRWVKL